MKHKIPAMLFLLLAFAPAVAVDAESGAYKTGQIAGYLFMAVLAVLILRKLFKK